MLFKNHTIHEIDKLFILYVGKWYDHIFLKLHHIIFYLIFLPDQNSLITVRTKVEYIFFVNFLKYWNFGVTYSWPNRSKLSRTNAWPDISRISSVSSGNLKKSVQPYVRVTFGMKVRPRISKTYAWPEMKNKLISQRDICKFTISSADILDLNHDFRFEYWIFSINLTSALVIKRAFKS